MSPLWFAFAWALESGRSLDTLAEAGKGAGTGVRADNGDNLAPAHHKF